VYAFLDFGIFWEATWVSLTKEGDKASVGKDADAARRIQSEFIQFAMFLFLVLIA
jgi:hypothetical protein